MVDEETILMYSIKNPSAIFILAQSLAVYSQVPLSIFTSVSRSKLDVAQQLFFFLIVKKKPCNYFHFRVISTDLRGRWCTLTCSQLGRFLWIWTHRHHVRPLRSCVGFPLTLGARTCECAGTDRAHMAAAAEHLSRPQTGVVAGCAKWPSMPWKAIF